jgi:murein DD-endopeptidase MepM/ murein hydrolase activator NlpD
MATQPVKNGRITCKYGDRPNPFNPKVNQFHKGVDFGANDDKNIYCAKPGKVGHIDKTRVYNSETQRGAFGNVVYIQLSDGWFSVYAHMDSIESNIRIGDYIEEGEVIGVIGNTGRSKGEHLHYEERDNMSAKSNSREPKDVLEKY